MRTGSLSTLRFNEEEAEQGRKLCEERSCFRSLQGHTGAQRPGYAQFIDIIPQEILPYK